MPKLKVFISSVQAEFKEERQALFHYLSSDSLLGKFFEPFIFENVPALDNTTQQLYLEEVLKSEIYLGLFGKEYGFQDIDGVSPTEKEFDCASLNHKTRLVFITNHQSLERHIKQVKLIEKAQTVVIRKRFNQIDDLKTSVYGALVRFLEEKGYIQIGPFDATRNKRFSLSDISTEKVNKFVSLASSKRGFPIKQVDGVEAILTHLNLLDTGLLTNASILLFGKEPQKFFINSEVRCASFSGTIVSKPIPSYKVFKGDVFELVDKTVEFVLSKIDYELGTRSSSNDAMGKYEIPREIISEAIVNAIAHRDYSSNASVQIFVFRDRIEILNPGSLPLGWTTQKLKELHSSVPSNPLLAEPMYLAGYIERLGTGTSDMIRISKENDLKEPFFEQTESFRTVLFRKSHFTTAELTAELTAEPTAEPTAELTAEPTAELTAELTAEPTAEIESLLMNLSGEMKRSEIQKQMKLNHDEHFRLNYLLPALERGYVQMKYPKSPNHPNQRYHLTKKGVALRDKLMP